MSHQRIRSGGEFEPKAGYCRAVVTEDGWVHVAGTVGVDHATGHLPDDVTEQCANALRIIAVALEQAGARMADVVRVHYILPERADFEPCWPQLRAAFGDAPPAATMIQAGLLDAAMKIEIEVTAKIPAQG
ncbi:RidA family protein [Pseudooceanicola aestuarii]|uniref:RidA family protein n=1 Tax=Pseudooceanicola aestuarii TaxID=2697319 RepID=UPI0013D43233|nr:RidA family protein [Pseudooceanicola aestuarii]